MTPVQIRPARFSFDQVQMYEGAARTPVLESSWYEKGCEPSRGFPFSGNFYATSVATWLSVEAPLVGGAAS